MATDAGRLYAYGSILTLATTSIVVGSFSSLRPPKAVKKRMRESAPDKDVEEDEEETPALTKGEAYLFPILGSAVLLGFYVVLRFVGPEWINLLLGWYFSVIGFASVWKSLNALTRFCVGPSLWQKFPSYQFMLLEGAREVFSIPFRLPTVFLSLPALGVSVLYNWSTKKHWVLTNVLSLSLAQNTIGLLKLDGFMTGVILLAGLFVYDVWWVFGTDVMVTVATNLDIPIKVLWPKTSVWEVSPACTMLGLGDIVIPGVFVALALRYDLSLVAADAPFPPYTPLSKFPKPYFTATVVAYVLGLATTITVMEVFHAAQPALLYLSPACILAFLLTAVSRGELAKAWAWNADESPGEDKQAALTENHTAALVQDIVANADGGPSQLPVQDVPNDVEESDAQDGIADGKARRRSPRKRRV